MSLAVPVMRRLDSKPILNQERSLSNFDAFLAADKIDDAPSLVTVPEANPAISGNAHAELASVVTGMQRTGSAQTVSASMQPVRQAVMLQDLNHGDRSFK